MKNILILGASGHGRVVMDCVEQEGKYKVMGFLDSYKRKDTIINGYDVLGSERELLYLSETLNIYGIIIAIGDNWTRHLLAKRVSSIMPDIKFVSTIHPSATIGKDVVIGAGSVVLPGTIVNTNCRIGKHCILNTNSSLDHDSVMEDFSSLAPRVCTGGNLVLGEFSAICLGANVIENISIRPHSVIGAGSLVIRDVPSHTLAFGLPARAVRKRSTGERYLSVRKFPETAHLYRWMR